MCAVKSDINKSRNMFLLCTIRVHNDQEIDVCIYIYKMFILFFTYAKVRCNVHCEPEHKDLHTYIN